jgi:Rrf2 family transcriptional regulator, iron-sulfur cluster assembly transcription factor
MTISTKGRYALRVMIDLCEHDADGYTPLKEIAERQDISEKYLESIIAALVRAGFLRGVRGKGGGYRLSGKPETYTVKSILEATEGPLVPVACMEHNPNRCTRAAECKTLPMWTKFGELVSRYFEGITLADLAANACEQDQYSI